MTNWLEDERGKTIQVNGTSYPDRKNLTITAPGALTTDSEAGQATVLDFSALTVGGAVGPADAVQYTDGAGALFGSAGFRYVDASRDLYLRALDGTTTSSYFFENSAGSYQGQLSYLPAGNLMLLEASTNTLRLGSDVGVQVHAPFITHGDGAVASNGSMRVEDVWSMYARNQGNSGNIRVMSIAGDSGTTSTIQIGDTSVNEIELDATTVTVPGGIIAMGTTPAGTGKFRVEDTWSMYARNNGDTANLPVFNIVVIDATSSRVEVGSSNLDVNIRGALTQGGTPSTSGYYRTEAAWNMYARNQGNTGNLPVFNIAANGATQSTIELGSANMHVRQKGPTAYDTKTASFTVALGEEGTDLYCNSGSAIVITLTDDATQAIPINSRVFFYHEGAGALTVVAGGTATIIGGSKTSDGQYSDFIARKVAADTWKVTGEVS